MPYAVDYERGVNDAWTSIATFFPKLVAFFLILLIGWILAKVIAKIVDAVLERVGFDRAVERGGVAQALSRSKYDASDIVAKLAYYVVFLTALVMAFNVFGPNPISDLLARLVAFLPQVAIAILIIVIAAMVAKAVKDIVGGALGGLSYGGTLASVASIAILALGVIAALGQVGVATAVTTPVLVAILATVGGILVVGVGGGLVRPMQSRWERWLTGAEEELPKAKAQVQSAPSANTSPAERYATDGPSAGARRL